MRTRLISVLVLVVLGALTRGVPAFAETAAPGWELSATTFPTNILPASMTKPGHASGTIGIDVFNIGAKGTDGSTITVTDVLPSGVKAKEAGQLNSPGFYGIEFGTAPALETSDAWLCTGNGPEPAPKVLGATIVTCVNNPSTLSTFAGGGGTPTFGRTENLNYPQPAIGVAVETDSSAPEGTRSGSQANHVSIDGGGAPGASAEDPVTISSAPAPGGLAQADAWFSNANGTIDRQAGSHPYGATFVLTPSTALEADEQVYFPGGELRDLETEVPPGFIGDLHNVAQCTRQQLIKQGECPPASMVGRLVTPTFDIVAVNQVYNMVPQPGVPAELGFFYELPVYISFGVKTGGDYSIAAHVNNIPQRGIYQSILQLWGVPQDATHNVWRYGNGGCSPSEMEAPAYAGGGSSGSINYCHVQAGPVVSPFLTLPTSCGPAPSVAFRELNGWQNPLVKSEVSFPLHSATDEPAGFSGCDGLLFEPSISTSPDTSKADTPTGLTVEVKPPLAGLEDPEGMSSADIKDTTVALPPGLVINPGQAAGLQACGAAEDELTTAAEQAEGRENDSPAKCPNASKVGTATIDTPLIGADEEKQFDGNVYVLQSNPPELKLLLAASADGVNLKLVGDVSLCEAAGEVLDGKACQASGQLITRFADTPQVPFTDFKLSFSGGPQAALDTPAQCGTYIASTDFTPWGTPETTDYLASSSFALTEGPGGAACPSNPMPFSPSLIAGATTDQAGGYTSFSMLLRRADGQQRIEKLSFKIPQGLAGMISQVPLCGEADANAGTCPAASRIGHSTVTSGPGPYPLVIPQPGEPEAPIYLTGPYKGAPFGLAIVTPVIAGPFNLGTIVTRASISVDPRTAQITVTTDPLPQIVKGVPTDLREINAVIERPGFMFNPTNCNPQTFSGTATSSQGAQAAISSPFGMGSCQALKFAPKFTASTTGKTSRQKGASLHVKLVYPKAAQGTQANISSVKVALPKQLPSNLKTLQKACPAHVFETDPADCSAESRVGQAVAHTPVLPVPLTGPAYFVSYGGAKFPELVIVLQGDNVTIDLHGETFIDPKTNVTTSTFRNVPDVPVDTFELTLPQGNYSALAAPGNKLCQQKLKMPTVFKAQNGAALRQNTSIAVTGCAKHARHARGKTHRHKKK